MDTDPSHWIAALSESHGRLRALVEPLGEDALVAPSFCSDWSIAQVLSHLGSGAEIFGRILEAALADEPLPGREQFEPIWATWNAKSAKDKASDALAVDARLTARFTTTDEVVHNRLRLSLFGMDLDAVGLLRMRLGEHAIHTWDIAVALDERATVAGSAVELLIDTVDQLVGRAGKPTGEAERIFVHTSGPEREFVLEIGESVSLTDAKEGVDAPGLELPAEALLRLVYGRLDGARADVATEGVDLNLLKRVFPGL